jgi:thiosulfate dehydrogenase
MMRVSERFRPAMMVLIVCVLLPGCRDAESRTSSGKRLELVPASATLDLAGYLPRDPARAALPTDARGEQIQLGFAIVTNPAAHMPSYRGNALACTNCHLNAGQRNRAIPWVGVAATFPQYRPREGRLITLEDRIQHCFERSLDAEAPAVGSREMMAVAAYISWISEGQPVGVSPAWRGLNRIPRERQIPIDRLDTERGRELFLRRCALCHGNDGQGIDLGVARAGPLWGPRSWSDGAGAARIYTLAGYVRYAMPLDAPGSLTDEEAQQIAAYINSHERPAFARKHLDYPNGDVPRDAVYYPQRFAENPLMRQREAAEHPSVTDHE